LTPPLPLRSSALGCLTRLVALGSRLGPAPLLPYPLASSLPSLLADKQRITENPLTGPDECEMLNIEGGQSKPPS